MDTLPAGAVDGAAPATLAADAAPTADAVATGTAPSSSLRGKVPLTFAVSSQVVNPSKSPADLVDGSMDTAWNSRTGQLVGAWIAVRVPAEARVTALRMTVGATAPATAGADPFTMNHRISRVRVTRNGEPVAELDLDPEVRTLQDLPVGTPDGLAGGDFKIEILATIPGSKKFWREVCVSELDVIGTAPATPGDLTPVVAIGSLDAEPVLDDALPLEPMPAVASMQEVCDRIGLVGKECAPRSYDPLTSVGLPPPATVPGWSRVSVVGGEGQDCHLVVEAGTTVYATRLAESCHAPLDTQAAPRVADVIRGGQPELVIRLRHELRPPAGGPPPVLKPPDLSYETLRVCGATAAGVPGCTEGLVIAGISAQERDRDYVETVEWDLSVSADDGLVIVRKGRGEASSDYPDAAEPGRYRVRP